MHLLAIDTATERCSVALSCNGALFERSEETPRAHADLILPMVAEVLREAQMRLIDVAGIAYGRGPGAFTGVRIAIGVAQGLAFGANLPTVGISNLAAVAQQVAEPDDEVLVCMDARMGEVYVGRFRLEPGERFVHGIGTEAVVKPDGIQLEAATRLAGTGLSAYPVILSARGGELPAHGAALPRARDILYLAQEEFAAGRAKSARDAQPVYLRDQVAIVKGA
jgi:tRNA threonylcarbamoyladenosine biosynthesis protein TsaB